MVEIQRDHESTDGASGKSLHHIARYTEPRVVGSDKSVTDIVTEDGRVYRFQQLDAGERWKFAPGQGRDNRTEYTGRLPNVVEEILDAEFMVEGDDGLEPDPGYYYGR